MKTSNIDPTEIDKFSQHASHWWDQEGEMKALHAINPLRLRFIQEKTVVAGKKIIDVGCGGGILTESLAKLGGAVTGIDMSTAALKVAKLHQIESGLKIDYRQMTAEDMALSEPEQFDVVTCMEMLEHVPDPISIVKACARLVKPEGEVFFSTLNRNVKAYFFAIIGAEYLLKLLPKNTHDYAKFIRPSELEAWGREAGLRLQDMRGIGYNPFSKEYKLTEDVSVNYLVSFKKDID